ncbi:uroporphyrinogen-III synthase [Yoonia litorea]|uniref:Uroporphyrinogen-III synthase n=1 Tax=Yoonia litorea TaxID=1123755 RepID=A0A1I6MV27_9RHOB|nr:uroporphyrinogen-III synthase [Yoonia litorea]SFS19570.1 uroporphyrinogen-III synthase [Yoonia litorea]
MTPTLLLTRPEGQNAPFAKTVEARIQGALKVIGSPLLEICFFEVAKPKADAVILTSLHGVRAAKRLGLNDGRTAWCVGQKTSEAAGESGFAAITGPGDAHGLASSIISARPEGTLAHIRGTYTRGQIAEKLKDAGLNCHDVVAYEQKALALSPEARECLDQSAPVVVPLFSPRTADIFMKQGPFKAPLSLVAMSKAVQDATAERPVAEMRLAKKPDAASMTDAVVQALKALDLS